MKSVSAYGIYLLVCLLPILGSPNQWVGIVASAEKHCLLKLNPSTLVRHTVSSASMPILGIVFVTLVVAK